MAKPIEVTDNIKECIDILDEFVNGDKTPNDEIAINAMKYLKITTDNALSSGMEPKGCPRLRTIEPVK